MVNLITASSIPAVGEWVGKYRLLKELEIGRQGTVFAAEEPSTQRAVIVRLRPRHAAERPGFLDATRKLMRLDHPHIATTLDAGEIEGWQFLVMEFPQGETLQDRLKREHCLPLKESLRIGREVAAGLTFAHAHGLIHGDLSPATVWLEPSSRVRLVGFDARPSDMPDSLLNRLEDAGTPGCLSPEQAAGEPLSPAADLFALGCILYQTVTGERPFRGDQSAALYRAVVFEHPTPIRAINPGLPESLENLIARLLAKLPADRPSSAAAVERQLMQWLDPLAPTVKPLDALAYPASRRILEAIESMKSPAVAMAPVARRDASVAVKLKARRTWWIDLIAAVLLIAGAAGLYRWWKASNDKPPQAPAAKSRPEFLKRTALMDAVILAAGLGTRLRPHTLTTPKPLLPVQGRPILDWIIGALPPVDRLLVVVNYLAEEIDGYLAKQTHVRNWTTVRQEVPRGTGDALRVCRAHLSASRLLVLNGDDLYGAADLAALANKPMGLLAHPVDEPRKYGIIFPRADGTIERLVEKPDLDGRQLANIGAYLFPKSVFDIELPLSPRGEYEITDAVSSLAKSNPFHVVEASFWLPIGTVAAWEAAQTADLRACSPVAEV